MQPTLVFDIETIPDLAGFSAVNGIAESTLPAAELAEMALLARRQKTGSDFMPHHLHRIVAISCVLRSGDQLKVWSLGETGSDEAELIQRFYDGIERYTPQLVSWNGGGFDLPVFEDLLLLYQVADDLARHAGEDAPAPAPGVPVRADAPARARRLDALELALPAAS